MNWNTIIASAFAVIVGVIAFAREWTASQGLRSRIKADVELLDHLPNSSSMRDALTGHIDRNIARLIRQEQDLRRDRGGIALAGVFAIITIWTVVRALDGTDWWWIATGVSGVFTIAGFAVSVPKVKRDERGRAIKESSDSGGVESGDQGTGAPPVSSD